MRFSYKAFAIDATPEFSVGIYFARVRITREPSASEEEGETVEEDQLGHFQTEQAAVEFAHRWAIDWIDENWL